MALTKVTGQVVNTSTDLTVGVLTATTASFTGNVSVGGTLTYEDVTNVDSVGLITARNGISVTGSNISVESSEDRLLYLKSTDANAYLTFEDTDSSSGFANRIGSVSDALYFSTGGGGERARIDSSGRLLLGTTTEGNSGADDLTIATSGNTGITIRSGTSDYGNIYYSDATSGTGEYAGYVSYQHSTNSLQFATASTERLRIDSSGRLLVGTSSATDNIRLDAKLAIVGTDSGASGHTGLTMSNYCNRQSVAPFIDFKHSRGSTDGSFTAVIDDDTLGYLVFQGADGDEFRSAAQIQGEVDGTPGDNDMPGRLVFSTSADGSSEPAERMRIDSSGNLGLGETAPLGKLHVKTGDSGASSVGSAADELVLENSTDSGMTFLSGTSGYASINFADSGDANVGQILYSHGSNYLAIKTNDSERLRIDSSGRLLLGTTTEGEGSADDLTIANANNCGITLRSGTAFQSNIFFSDGTSGAAEYDGFIAYNQNARHMLFGTAQTERVRIDSSGRLQIGASNNTGTNTKLVVGAGNNINTTAIINTGDVDVNALTLSNWDGSTTTNKLMMHFDSSGIGAFNIGMPAATDAFVIDDGGTERFRIDSDGDLKFGDQSASTANNSTAVVHLDAGREYWSGTAGDYRALKHRLYYVNTEDAYGLGVSASLLEIQSQTAIGFFAGSAGAASGRRVERMRLTSDGFLCIGNTSTVAGAKLGITFSGATQNGIGLQTTYSGTGSDYIRFNNSAGNQAGEISQSGTTSVSYTTSSDYRLKENVVDIADGIARVKQLAPKRFNFIEDADTTVDGFLAHEAQTVVPEAVTGTHNEVDDDGNAVMQGIDTSKLVPLLTAALQEAIAEIETLKTKVAALEG